MQMRDLGEFGRWTAIKGDEIVSKLYVLYDGKVDEGAKPTK